MNGLLLHCGSQLKTREEVFAVPVPAATPTYTPLPYESFILRIEKQLTVEGIRMTEERLAMFQQPEAVYPHTRFIVDLPAGGPTGRCFFYGEDYPIFSQFNL